MIFKHDIHLKLCKELYKSAPANFVDEWEMLHIKHLSNHGNLFKKNNFTCAAYKKEREIIIVFRGPDNAFDFLASDLSIALRQIPVFTLMFARKFYKAVKSFFPQFTINFTGHSLGGSYAQLMGAYSIKDKYPCEAISFNAPGMLMALEDIKCHRGGDFSNVINYIVLNDCMGNFRRHVGKSYYIQPIPMVCNSDLKTNADPLFDTHCSILNYSEEFYGPIYENIKDFETKEAVSLWYADVNNTLTVENPLFLSIISKANLENALSIIKTEVGQLLYPFHFNVDGFDYYLETQEKINVENFEYKS